MNTHRLALLAATTLGLVLAGAAGFSLHDADSPAPSKAGGKSGEAHKPEEQRLAPEEQAKRDETEGQELVDERTTDAEDAPHDECGREVLELDEKRRASEPAFVPAKATFALSFRDEVSPHRLMSVFLLPGETLDVEATLLNGRERLVFRALEGRTERESESAWRWTAPDAPGVYRVEVSDRTSGEVICLNVFVMHPYEGEEVFEGYRIGRYERLPLRGNPAYEMPRGLIEVTPENEDTWVSPHFQLRQFLCKQQSDYPKFLVLRTRLLLKLEMLLEELNDEGIPAHTFYVMSGYRTPYYNRSIGNRSRYSRHAYGDAADIFVDMDEDGRMDDIDESGKVNRSDARLIYDLVNSMVDDTWYSPFLGGLGLYGPAPHRGPFVHVDTRGRAARWTARRLRDLPSALPKAEWEMAWASPPRKGERSDPKVRPARAACRH